MTSTEIKTSWRRLVKKDQMLRHKAMVLLCHPEATTEQILEVRAVAMRSIERIEETRKLTLLWAQKRRDYQFEWELAKYRWHHDGNIR